jgi:hypothetical protein
MNRVDMAEPYRYMATGSLGDATAMYLSQYRFPFRYASNETVWSVDHDRIIGWNYDHWENLIKKYKEKMGDYGLETWFIHGKSSDLLAFIVEALETKTKNVWTGYRILCTVNKMNGNPVYTLQLFAKAKDSTTPVYSSERAPNVKQNTIYNPRNSYGMF